MNMRIHISTAATFLWLTLPSPAAADCYWVGREIWCTPGCRVTDQWWDGYQEWMRYSCAPSPEVMLAIAFVVIVVIAIIGSIASSSAAPTDLQEKTREADAQAAEAARITERLKAAAREADKFLGR
jgi:hypothetical protein